MKCRFAVLGLVLILSVLALTGCDGGWEITVKAADGDEREVVRGSGTVIAEERAVSDFDHVSLAGAGRVIITQGDEEALTVETDDNVMPYIKTEVRNNKLTLSFTNEGKRNNFRPSKGITFHLQVKEVGAVTIAGAGKIVAASLDAERLEINLGGAGDISIDALSAEELEVHLSGAGDIRLMGRVTEQDVELNGAGSYHAGKLESKTVRVTLNGVGNATVWSTGTLDARIRGVGNISYYGQPQVITSSAGVSGLVNLGNR